MATSGSTTVNVDSNGYLQMKISWTLNSQSTSNNTSNITFKAQLVAGSAGAVYSSASKSYTATINGTSYTGTNSVAISNNSTTTLFSKTLTISHDSDGSKSFTYSYNQTFDINFNGSIGSKSASLTVTPTTIARASSITSASSVTLGNAVSIKWTPASSSFAYKLKFTVGSNSYTTGYISPGTTSAYTYTGYTMSIADWAPYITSATSATCTVVLYTYSSSSSSSSIGSSSSSFTVSVPSSVVPTVSIGSVAEAGGVTLGVYVQAQSKVKVTFTGTSAYSSSLKSYTVAVGSLSYSGTSISSGSSKSVTSDALASSGSVTVKVTVTDARGRSGSASQTITVYAYSSPAVTTFTAERVDSSGNPDDNGTKVKITYNYSVSSCNSKNTCSMTIKSKESTASSYSTTIVSSSSLSGNTSTTPSTTYDDQKGYDFQLSITDAFGTITSIASIGTGIVPLSVYYNGTGLGIGKVAESPNLLDVAWKIKVTAANPVIEVFGQTNANTYIRATSFSGNKISFGIGSGGSNRGLYDNTVSNWMIHANSNHYIYVGDTTGHTRVYIGNTSIPLYLRGSTISHSGTFQNDISTIGYIYAGATTSTTTSGVYCRSSYGEVRLWVSTASNKGVYDGTKGQWIIYSNSSGTIVTNSLLTTTDLGDIETLSSAEFKNPTNVLTKIKARTMEMEGKKHLGFTVADVENALVAAGMDPEEYDITERWEEDGKEVGAIRYEEMIPMLVSEIQSLEERISKLESEA